MKQLFKNKKGSQLVEKILMTAFAVAAGAACITYGSSVLASAKNTEITGILGNSGSGVVATNSNGMQLMAGKRYKFSSVPDLSSSNFQKTDAEYFSCSRVFKGDGTELKISNNKNGLFSSWEGFIGYSFWLYNNETEEFYLEDPRNCEIWFFALELSDKAFDKVYGVDDYYSSAKKYYDDNHLSLNEYADEFGNISWSFEFSGTYVRQGNGPCLLDYLIEVE